MMRVRHRGICSKQSKVIRIFLRCHIQRRAETVKKMQETHDSAVAWFKKTTVELNIPCDVQSGGIVQEIEPLGEYPDY